MTKVLVIITTEFVSYGGLTTVMMNYYRKMDKSGIQIDFASTNVIPPDLKEELDRNGSAYHFLGKRSRFFRYFFNERKVLRNGRYDVVHVHGNNAIAALELLPAYFCRVPKRIIHIHTSVCQHKRLNALLSPIFHRLYTDAVACSQKAGEWIFKTSFFLLPNAIDSEKYAYNERNRKAYRKEFSTEENTIVIGNLGKMDDGSKNHPFIIACFAQIIGTSEGYELWLAGDGQHKAEFEQQVADLGLSEKVRFLGMCSEVEMFLSAIDVFFFPSLWEGMPLSVLEAQCTGLPCLISDHITEEVVVTPLVTQMELDRGRDAWSEKLKTMKLDDRTAASSEARAQIEKTDFDITRSCKLLRELYLS